MNIASCKNPNKFRYKMFCQAKDRIRSFLHHKEKFPFHAFSPTRLCGNHSFAEKHFPFCGQAGQGAAGFPCCLHCRPGRTALLAGGSSSTAPLTPRLVREAPCPARHRNSGTALQSATMYRGRHQRGYFASQLFQNQSTSIDVEIFHLPLGCYRSLFQVFRPTGNEAT